MNFKKFLIERDVNIKFYITFILSYLKHVENDNEISTGLDNLVKNLSW